MPIIKRRPQAIADLYDIYDYIAVENHSRQNAERFIQRLNDSMAKLATHPLMGKDRSLYRSNLRAWPVGSYLIFYEPIPNGIDVIRVLHGKRDIARVLGQK